MDTASLASAADEMRTEGHTVMFVGVNGGAAGAIGVTDPIKGSTLVLVCVQKPNTEVTADELSYTVVHGLGTPFKPKEVLFVPDLPKTRNLKIMRRVIRAAYLGENPGDVSSLVNPESIAAIRAKR